MRTVFHIIRHAGTRMIAMVVVALVLSASGGAQQPNQVRGAAGPGQAPAYLALGDSYPYGSDGSGLLPNNDNYWVGYPEILAQILDHPVVNAACPGETTASFLDLAPGGPRCQAAKDAGLLHVDYTGSQMDFVDGYLATHDRTVLITLQLGGNDFQVFAAQCGNRTSCILAGFPAFVAGLARNFDTILDRIRSAGYEGPIVVVEYPTSNYNGATAQLQKLINQSLAPVGLAYNAQIAPLFESFRLAALPYGGYPCAAGLLLTYADGSCNIHPTFAGHQFIADIIAEMLPAARSATR